MIADTGLLLGLRLQMVWNGWRKRSLAGKLLMILGFGWLGLFAGGFTGGLGAAAGALLRRYPEAGLDALIPGVVLTLITLLLLFTSFGTELGSLYLTNDLDLLMSAPVDRRAVFISKMLDSVGVSYVILLFTAVPLLTVYGLVLGYGPLYFAFMAVSLVAAPLLPAGIGALLVMFVARFAPARRVREVLAFVAALFSMAVALLGQTSRIWMRNLFGAETTLEALLAKMQGLANVPFPTLLAGRGLAGAGTGNWGEMVVGLGAYLALTGGLFAACVLVADRIYTQGWVRMQSGGIARRSQARVARDAAHSGWIGRAPADLAIALKDWRMIPRDLRNFAQMLWPLLMLPVVYINLLGGAGRNSLNALQAADELAQGRIDPTGIFVALGVLATTVLIFTNIATTCISMEGKAWWLLKAAPVTPFELLRGKYLVALVPFVVLSSLLMTGATIWKGFSLFGFLYGWLGVELLGAGALAIAVGFAVPWAKLDWDNPKQMASGWGGLLTTGTQFVVGVVGGLFLLAPLAIEALAPGWSLVAYAAGLLGAAVITIGSAGVVFQIGLSRLPRVGEA